MFAWQSLDPKLTAEVIRRVVGGFPLQGTGRSKETVSGLLPDIRPKTL